MKLMSMSRAGTNKANEDTMPAEGPDGRGHTDKNSTHFVVGIYQATSSRPKTSPSSSSYVVSKTRIYAAVMHAGCKGPSPMENMHVLIGGPDR